MSPHPVVIVSRCFEATYCPHLQGFSWMFWHLFYWLHEAESFLRSLLVLSQSRNSPHFMEPDGSLQRLQVPVTRPYPDTNPYSPCSPSHVMKIHVNIISHLRQCLPSGLSPSGFTHQKCMHLFSLPYVLHAPLVSFIWFVDPIYV
jgi:hypothetical protein